MSSQVTYPRLRKALQELGFAEMRRGMGAHVIFKHEKTGAVLTVPARLGPVPQVYVNTAARQIANSGISTTDDFKRLLANGATKAAS